MSSNKRCLDILYETIISPYGEDEPTILGGGGAKGACLIIGLYLNSSYCLFIVHERYRVGYGVHISPPEKIKRKSFRAEVFVIITNILTQCLRSECPFLVTRFW